MQQYFVDEELKIGEEYLFTKEQRHHAKTVARLENEKVRLVYRGKAYYALAFSKGNDFVAEVLEKDPINRELKQDIILAMSLIRREKFEFVLQKATELGVSKIIPIVTSRCIVQAKKDKQERYTQIVLEAAQQCKRDRIPEMSEVKKLKEITDIPFDTKIVAYEKEEGTKQIVDAYQNGKNTLVLIGPEGGFSEEEIEELTAHDFQSVSLGKRILRAETAAVYALSILANQIESE